MGIAAKQLIKDMYRPRQAFGVIKTMRMIPKKVGQPMLMDIGSEAWGIHARQSFSLLRIMAWFCLITVLGLIFVGFWLGFVAKTNLQNAFMVFLFLATMMTFGLGVSQLLNVD